jgi:hypothetical protein
MGLKSAAELQTKFVVASPDKCARDRSRLVLGRPKIQKTVGYKKEERGASVLGRLVQNAGRICEN